MTRLTPLIVVDARAPARGEGTRTVRHCDVAGVEEVARFAPEP